MGGAESSAPSGKPAWKQAKGVKRKQGDDDKNKCWDYVSGYCYRGAKCRWVHVQESVVDQSILDAHFELCVKWATEAGVNLSEEALHELQTLTAKDAHKLVQSLAVGGEHEGVFDKSSFVVHAARR